MSTRYHIPCPRFSFMPLIFLALLASAFYCDEAIAKKKALPPFSKVQKVVQRHFSTLPDHKPGDIISKSDVEPVFKQLRVLGWKVGARQSILNQVLDDQDFVVQQLRSKAGRKMMRKMASYQQAFDRLERVSKLPGGKALVRDLIKLPDAHEYMQDPPKPPLKDLTHLLPKRANGKLPKAVDFDKPTGHIYTQEQLLQRLKQSHARAKRPKAAKRRRS